MKYRIREAVIYGCTWYIPEVRRYFIWRPCCNVRMLKRAQWWHGCPTKDEAFKELNDFRAENWFK